jgi:hypothetical protein
MRLCPMCGQATIGSTVLACYDCWGTLPIKARREIMSRRRGNVRARAFFTYLHKHGLSRLSRTGGGR